MKIALIGASGNAGTRILAELSRRGHAVTAIARHPENVPALDGVTPVKADANDVPGLAAALKQHVVVVSSVHFTASDPQKLIEAAEFPAMYKAEAAAGSAFLDLLRKETTLDWTFLSPSALFVPGERTGRFRLGGDQLLTNEKGSSISFEDYAVAMADEI